MSQWWWVALGVGTVGAAALWQVAQRLAAEADALVETSIRLRAAAAAERGPPRRGAQ